MTLKRYLFQIPLIGKLKIIVPNIFIHYIYFFLIIVGESAFTVDIANKLDIDAYGKDPQEAVKKCLKFLVKSEEFKINT